MTLGYVVWCKASDGDTLRIAYKMFVIWMEPGAVVA